MVKVKNTSDRPVLVCGAIAPPGTVLALDDVTWGKWRAHSGNARDAEAYLTVITPPEADPEPEPGPEPAPARRARKTKRAKPRPNPKDGD